MSRKILVQIPSNQIQHFITKATLQKLHSFGEIEWNPYHGPFPEEELAEKLADVHTTITSWNSIPLSDSILAAANKLQLVAHMAGSVKPILPSSKVYEQGVTVLNSNYAIAVSVSESVLALILALGHKIIPTQKLMSTHMLWKTSAIDIESYELRGRTVGLIGLGMVAQEVIKLLQPFDINIVGYDPFFPKEVANELNITLLPLHDVLSQAHIISLHAPQIPETYHMIGNKELALLRDQAILINTARGNLIDQCALTEHLRSKRFYAGLDVFEVEPLPLDSELRFMENVIVRPHLAGVNPNSRLRIGAMMVDEMERFYNGEPLKFEVKQAHLANMT
ncbi:hydroxyacid dehydrogenase [Paenibacillus yanchengensis]|uniref:Hydroxyacid dehydrogenase n=1 Tax=Paenibacillus yanchengensis TaxID=2035833 RepID=A0ABW4YI38_9BACL